MNFNGIALAEWKLLLVIVVTNVFLVFCAIFTICYFFAMRQVANPKEEARIKKLKSLAETDTYAAKQLRKLERKKKHRKNRDRDLRTEAIFVNVLIIVLFFITLFYITIPTWKDYTIKDYVVYEGEFEVFRSQRCSRIKLKDGTIIWGSAGFDYGEHEGTLVYAKRSEVVLGGE